MNIIENAQNMKKAIENNFVTYVDLILHKNEYIELIEKITYNLNEIINNEKLTRTLKKSVNFDDYVVAQKCVNEIISSLEEMYKVSEDMKLNNDKKFDLSKAKLYALIEKTQEDIKPLKAYIDAEISRYS